MTFSWILLSVAVCSFTERLFSPDLASDQRALFQAASAVERAQLVEYLDSVSEDEDSDVISSLPLLLSVVRESEVEPNLALSIFRFLKRRKFRPVTAEVAVALIELVGRGDVADAELAAEVLRTEMSSEMEPSVQYLYPLLLDALLRAATQSENPRIFRQALVRGGRPLSVRPSPFSDAHQPGKMCRFCFEERPGKKTFQPCLDGHFFHIECVNEYKVMHRQTTGKLCPHCAYLEKFRDRLFQAGLDFADSRNTDQHCDRLLDFLMAGMAQEQLNKLLLQAVWTGLASAASTPAGNYGVNLAVVTKLLDAGAQINSHGSLVLLGALVYKQEALATLLVQRGGRLLSAGPGAPAKHLETNLRVEYLQTNPSFGDPFLFRAEIVRHILEVEAETLLDVRGRKALEIFSDQLMLVHAANRGDVELLRYVARHPLIGNTGLRDHAGRSTWFSLAQGRVFPEPVVEFLRGEGVRAFTEAEKIPQVEAELLAETAEASDDEEEAGGELFYVFIQRLKGDLYGYTCEAESTVGELDDVLSYIGSTLEFEGVAMERELSLSHYGVQRGAIIRERPWQSDFPDLETSFKVEIMRPNYSLY